jgi:hypothetical protein
MSYQRGQLQLVRNSDGDWSVVRWSLDGETLLNVIGTFKTRERAVKARLHILEQGKDILYKPRERLP